MNKTDYDVLVLGTGVTESVLSGLLSREGYDVLNIDKNSYYGDSTASLNLTQLWQRFLPNQIPPQSLGQDREWNIDINPKLIMAQGKLVQLILKTGIQNYLNWQCVQGSYVYQHVKGGMFKSETSQFLKVPGNDQQALKSDLMTMLEKRRCQKFFKFVQKFNIKDKKTYQKMSLHKMNFKQLTKEFGLHSHTLDFLGHAIALYTNNSYKTRPSLEVIKRLKLYISSIGTFGKSPFIYPMYGLSGIPESFARKSAIHGGTYMLGVDIKSIEKENNQYKITAIREGNKIQFYAKKIVSNPKYMKMLNMEHRIIPTNVCIRVVCILNHPVQGAEKDGAIQIILPQDQINRQSNIYIVVLGPQHGVCREGYHLAMISTLKESNNIEEDLKIPFKILGNIQHKFIIQEQLYKANEYKDNIFITASQDQTSNFESSQEDMIQIYKAMTGIDLELTFVEEEQFFLIIQNFFKQNRQKFYKMQKLNYFITFSIIFATCSCTNYVDVKSNEKLQHAQRDFSKPVLCSADELQFLHKHYRNYVQNAPVSLLTSTEELNNKMCSYTVQFNQNLATYEFQLRLSFTEFFDQKDKNKSCKIYFKFYECDQQTQPCNETFAYTKGDHVMLMTYVAQSLFDEDQEQDSCLSILRKEKDAQFEDRLRSKIEQIKNQLNHSMTKALNETPEILATSQIADNQKLEEIIVQQAIVKVLTERFPAYTKRIIPFKNMVQEYQPKFQWAVRKYLSENEEAIKEALKNYSGPFINKMEQQLSQQLVAVAQTQAVQTLLPQMTGDLSTTIASLIISFIVRFFFDNGYKMISNVISEVITKLYRMMMRMFNKAVVKKRHFKQCLDFPNFNLQELLQNNIHDAVSFEVDENKVMSCEAERIQISRITVGFEIKMEIQSPNGQCLVKLFRNQQNQISILPPDEGSYPCDSSLGLKKLIEQEQEEKQKFKLELNGELDKELFESKVTSRDLHHISFQNGQEIDSRPNIEDAYMYYV